MRKCKRFIKKFSERFIVYIVVFLAFVNACFFMPMEVQAADSFSISDYVDVAFDGKLIYSGYSDFAVSDSFSITRPGSVSSGTSSGSNYNTSYYDFYIPLQFRVYIPPSFSTAHLSGTFDLDFLLYLDNVGSSGFSWVDLDIYSVDAPSGVRVSGYPSSVSFNNGYVYGKHMWLVINFDNVNFNSYFSFNCYLHVVASQTFNVNPSGLFYLKNPQLTKESGFITSGYSISSDDEGIVNGYDDSAGNQVSSDFESGVNDYDQVEDNLFNTSTGALQGFEFFDFGSFSAVTSGLSFCSSLLTSIYENFGGLNGIGIVISVLFSVLFMAIVIGLFRYYK